jgi:putative transposase
MIQVQEKISLRRQCELLAVGRSGLYYEPVGTSAEELVLMRRIDEIHLEWPFYGSRKLCESLRNEGTVDQPQAHAAADALDGARIGGAQARHKQAPP